MFCFYLKNLDKSNENALILTDIFRQAFAFYGDVLAIVRFWQLKVQGACYYVRNANCKCLHGE